MCWENCVLGLNGLLANGILIRDGQWPGWNRATGWGVCESGVMELLLRYPHNQARVNRITDEHPSQSQDLFLLSELEPIISYLDFPRF